MKIKFFTKKRLVISGVVIFLIILLEVFLGTPADESDVQNISSNNVENNEVKLEEELQKENTENYVAISSDEIILDVPEPNPASDFMYQLTDDSNGVLITAYIGTNSVISIPSEIEGLPVTTVNALCSEDYKIQSFVNQVFFPDSVTDVGDRLFCECKKLNYVRLSQSCPKISSYMFSECEALKYIKISECVVTIEDGAFSGAGVTSITIPATVTKFGKYIFSDCKKLNNVKLPENMTVIPERMFSYCEMLSAIEIPNTVKELGESCFSNCEGILEIKLPENLEKIGRDCFWYCEKIESIKIPDTVTEIGASAFGGTGITELIIPESVNTEKISSGFERYFSINFIYGMEKLEVLRIPNSIKTIEDVYKQDFFPDSVKRTLRSVNLPESLELVKGDVFQNMDNLTELIIPDSLNKNIFDINAGTTFYGTTKLPLLTQKRLRELGYTGNFVTVQY